MSFTKNIGNIGKNISKNLSGKYRRKLFDHTKWSASKKSIQKSSKAIEIEV